MKTKIIAIIVLILFVLTPVCFAGAKTKAVDVDNKMCPVMGGKASSKISYVYEGKRYHFCCPVCISEFKKDPKKYIAIVEKEQAGTTAAMAQQ